MTQHEKVLRAVLDNDSGGGGSGGSSKLYDNAVEIFALLDRDVFPVLQGVPPVAHSEIQSVRDMLATPASALERTKRVLVVVQGMTELAVGRVQASSARAVQALRTSGNTIRAANVEGKIDTKASQGVDARAQSVKKSARKGIRSMNKVAPEMSTDGSSLAEARAGLSVATAVLADANQWDEEDGAHTGDMGMRMVEQQLSGCVKEVTSAIQFVFAHIDAAQAEADEFVAFSSSAITSAAATGTSITIPSSTSISTALSTSPSSISPSSAIALHSSAQFQLLEIKLKASMEDANKMLEKWLIDVRNRLKSLEDSAKEQLGVCASALGSTLEEATSSAVASVLGLANGVGDLLGDVLGEDIDGGEALKQLGGSAAVKLKELGMRWLKGDESWKVRERAVGGTLCIAQRIEATKSDMDKLHALEKDRAKITEGMAKVNKRKLARHDRNIEAVRTRLGLEVKAEDLKKKNIGI